MVKQIYFICFCATLSTGQLFGQRGDFSQFDFKKSDSVARALYDHSLLDLKTLSRKLTALFTTDVEKFRSIYKWVCENIDYDYATFSRNQKQRRKLSRIEDQKAWNREIRMVMYENLIHKRKSVCTGYAYLVMELARHAGIPCKIIDGYGRTVAANIRGDGVANHSWNAVELNKQWYLCDPTWSTGAFNNQDYEFIRKYDDSYFLADPALFIRNHYPLDTAWTLLDAKRSLTQFLNGPLIYSTIYKYRVTEIVPNTFDVIARKKEKTSIKFRMGDQVSISTIGLQVNRNGRITTIDVPVVKDPEGFYVIDHSFAARGREVVHLMVDGAYVFTMTYQVE